MSDTDTEVLYLAKGERDIVVEKCPKRQDVIDGIRFLYRQYVKKKPGVILSEPERCSSIIETVLFIKSVRPLLDRPTLVLCDEEVEQKWLDHFGTWTDMKNDITADTINPFTKKVSVYITPITEMGKYYSRDWSVIIVDSDIVHREILKDKLSGKFKIWITCVHVKENLNIFSQLYKWLYPKQTFDANLFKSNKNNPYDGFTKEIILESFMDDIVLKRNVKCVDNNNFMPSTPPPLKVTRKNKDATGTKIKRTKRKNRILSDEDSPNKINKTAEISDFEQNSFKIGEEISNVSSRNLTTSSNTTINSSITNIEPDDEMGNDQRDANREISKTRNVSYMETDVFETENNQIHNNERSKTQNDGNERDFSMENDQIDKCNNEVSILKDSTIKPEILKAENEQNDDSIKSDNSTNLLLQFDEESTPLIIDETKSNDSEYDKETQMNELESIQYFNEIKTNINEIENKITDTKTNLKNIDANPILNDIEIKNNNDNQIIQSENLFSTESISDLNKTKDELNKLKNKEENKVENNKTDSNIDSSSVDYKMKQLEELALKKFKGSFLDSLF